MITGINHILIINMRPAKIFTKFLAIYVSLPINPCKKKNISGFQKDTA